MFTHLIHIFRRIIVSKTNHLHLRLEGLLHLLRPSLAYCHVLLFDEKQYGVNFSILTRFIGIPFTHCPWPSELLSISMHLKSSQWFTTVYASSIKNGCCFQSWTFEDNWWVLIALNYWFFNLPFDCKRKGKKSQILYDKIFYAPVVKS